MFNVLHLELTSRCNKSCPMCGRRKLEKHYPKLCNWGDMDPMMVRAIAFQTSPGTVVQMHNNGEPTLYPYLTDALKQFSHCVRQFNTNAKLLLERADEIIGNMEVLTISVVEGDPEADDQYSIVKRFLERKRDDKPRMVYRLLGRIHKRARWTKLPGLIATRVLHSPEGSHDYHKKVVIPEIGICLDLLTHLAVDRYGNISLCVRFDPHGKLRLGNVNDISLGEAWYGEKRKAYLSEHKAFNRKGLPGCKECEFYGCPTSY